MKTFEHGGNIHREIRDNLGRIDQVLDFSANINPLGPPEWFRPLISSQLEHLVHYPDPEYTAFVDAIALHRGVSPATVVVGNGTTELLYGLMRAVLCKRAVIPVPSYVDYVRAAQIGGLSVSSFPIEEDTGFVLDLEKLGDELCAGDLVIIGSPNNPTGTIVDPESLSEMASNHPDCFFLIDEAFLDFVGEASSLAGTSENIITLHSMTKFYGLPGLRLGYGVFPEVIAEKLKSLLPPWTVNSLAQAVGIKALTDHDYQTETRRIAGELRQSLVNELGKIPQLQLFPGMVNFIFCKIMDGSTAAKLAAYVRSKNILIRRCENYRGLNEADRFFRIAVRTENENLQLINVLTSYFLPGKIGKIKRKTPGIMFQGTCSDAGKSIVTAALCRVLVQDGLQVAPFKAQNMSLNSFVTVDGLEMGRAQVVQAQASRLDPDCRMNPVLLKPNSDTGSQIIVCGKPVGNLSVLEYERYKPTIWEKICGVYDSLADEYDAIVLEGAGSPGEVNLKRGDIVNMRMARHAESPVLLVGDIDRGGVYASFVGIMEVLAEWERQLVAGFIVNKFRGQASLLDSAHEYVELHTGRKVYGVLPYIANLGLPEEDSVSFKKGIFNRQRKGEGIEIVLLNLPHISNFTDIEPFLEEPDVSLRVVDRISDIGNPEAIVLPGSKNVIHDLEYLKKNGFVEAIQACHAYGSDIIGICGGYQMLGRVIRDPYAIESSLGELQGIGMLHMETVIEKGKQLTRKEGSHLASGQKVVGYEIHHGVSTHAGEALFCFSDESSCGYGNADGSVWGSYLHGVFDSDSFRRWFIDRQRKRKGLTPLGKIVAPYDLERSFDQLADCFRASVDMDAIYRLLKL